MEEEIKEEIEISVKKNPPERWECICLHCKEKVDNFSIVTKNITKRDDFIFHERLGYICKVDIEYYGRDEFELIYQCKKCEWRKVSYLTVNDVYPLSIIDIKIFKLFDDFVNERKDKDKFILGTLLFKKIKQEE